MDKFSQRHVSEFSSEYANQRKREVVGKQAAPINAVFGLETLFQMRMRVEPSIQPEGHVMVDFNFTEDEINKCKDIIANSKEEVISRFRKGPLYGAAVAYFLNECGDK